MCDIDPYEQCGQRSVKVVCDIHRVFGFAVAVFGKVLDTDLIHGGKCAFAAGKISAENYK
ncbi:unknown [Anaerotruncus sp. CAG:390]|nr:unknown [Anaerotruncus sp. CAG:390]